MNFKSLLFPDIEETRPVVIAGPCSAETEEQVLSTARQLHGLGIKIFRAGVWKPRTKPGCFEGVGAPALKWLQRVRQETGMYTATEVATANHVQEALSHQVDLLWIGARTTTNPFAVQEIADSLRGADDVRVLIKNPVSSDLDLWIGAIERFYNAGIRRIGVIHRGFSSNDAAVYRNIPQWHIPIELKRRYPQLPVFCDPSHIGGRRNLIYSLSQQAMDLNYGGLIIESHCCPDEAWSDKEQQITPDELARILEKLVIRDKVQTTEDLSALRRQIDEIDNELLRLLARRMRVSREIGRYKLEHDMSVLQTPRYDHILKDRVEQAEKMEMSGSFTQKILEAIHAESVRQQFVAMESGKKPQ